MKATRIAWPLLAIHFLLTPTVGASDGHPSFQQALDLAQRGRRTEALDLFHHLTSEDSTNLEAWNNRAALEAALGDLDAARASLEHAVSVRPDVAVLSRNLEKVRSRQARLAYDSAFGTPSQLQPLALEFRPASSSASEADLRRERDSLRQALETAREDDRRLAQMRDSLSVRDREIARLRAAQAATVDAVVASAEPVTKTVAPPVRAPVAERRAETVVPGAARPDALAAVMAWAKAWSDRDVDTYLDAYVPGYHPAGATHGEWVEKRRDRIRAAPWIKVEVQEPKIVSAPGRAEIVYRQVYQTEGARLNSRKKIGLTLLDGKWKIEEEKEAR